MESEAAIENGCIHHGSATRIGNYGLIKPRKTKTALGAIADPSENTCYWRRLQPYPTTNNATINVQPAKNARAPRSKRAPGPSAKVRENQALRPTRRATRTESPPFQFRDVEDTDDNYEEENENTASGLGELLLVKDLKETIEQQSRSIQRPRLS